MFFAWKSCWEGESKGVSWFSFFFSSLSRKMGENTSSTTKSFLSCAIADDACTSPFYGLLNQCSRASPICSGPNKGEAAPLLILAKSHRDPSSFRAWLILRSPLPSTLQEDSPHLLESRFRRNWRLVRSDTEPLCHLSPSKLTHRKEGLASVSYGRAYDASCWKLSIRTDSDRVRFERLTLSIR